MEPGSSDLEINRVTARVYDGIEESLAGWLERHKREAQLHVVHRNRAGLFVGSIVKYLRTDVCRLLVGIGGERCVRSLTNLFSDKRRQGPIVLFEEPIQIEMAADLRWLAPTSGGTDNLTLERPGISLRNRARCSLSVSVSSRRGNSSHAVVSEASEGDAVRLSGAKAQRDRGCAGRGSL